MWPFSNYWEKKPLLLKRHQPEYYKGWFSCKEFDEILKKVSGLIKDLDHSLRSLIVAFRVSASSGVQSKHRCDHLHRRRQGEARSGRPSLSLACLGLFQRKLTTQLSRQVPHLEVTFSRFCFCSKDARSDCSTRRAIPSTSGTTCRSCKSFLALL